VRVLIFGASGFVGQGVLGEALASDVVSEVITVGRTPVPVQHPKLRQLEHRDFTDFSALVEEFKGVDACFWCLGISSNGMSEADYTRITLDFTKAAADVLIAASPQASFVFVSGAGTNPESNGMWQRVKGAAEHYVAKAGFARAAAFRPAMILGYKGAFPRDLPLKLAYLVLLPLLPVVWPLGGATSAARIGRAMLAFAQGRGQEGVYNSRQINALASS